MLDLPEGCSMLRGMRRHTGLLLVSCVVLLHFRPQDEPMEEEEPMNQ